MKEHLNALIIGLCIIIAAVIFALSSRYQAVPMGESGTRVLDRWTGEKP
jgi:hypothetical protein